MIEAGRTIQQVIDFIAKLNGLDVDQLSLNDGVLDPDKPLDAYSDSPDHLFVFSKALQDRPVPAERRKCGGDCSDAGGRSGDHSGLP
jgi:hypothetical protein